MVDLLQRTQQALPLLNQAFEKQYDQLLAGELMDTQVEIDVLQAALGRSFCQRRDEMKAKWIGLLLLIVVALGAVGYVWFSQSTQVTEITGYVGARRSACWRMNRCGRF